MSEETIPLPEQNYGPGNVLRAKREEYEWSVEAVAEALHLSTHSVKAIEADRYEDLPGATYVIGYWRSYARLLGIDIEETIEVNKRNLNIVTAEAAGLDINRAFGGKAKSGGKGYVLLLILLAALAFYAWQNQFFGLLDGFVTTQVNVTTPEESQAPEAPTISAAVIAPPENEAEQVLRPLKVEPAAPPEVPSSAAPQLAEIKLESAKDKKQDTALLTAQAPASGTQKGLVLAQNSAPSAAVNTTTNTNESVIPSQSAPAEVVPAPADSQTTDLASSQAVTKPSAPGMETMTLSLSKDSWLDIRDKTRKRLLYKTEKAGQTIEVTGEPPFYVYIGTPDGVTIQYRGKEIPFETHKTGMFARFKLDDELLEAL